MRKGLGSIMSGCGSNPSIAASKAERHEKSLEHFQPDWKIRLAHTTHCKWGAATPYQRTIDPHGSKNARFDIILPVSRDIGAGHAGGLARPPGSCQCKRSSSSALGAPPLTTGREYRQFSSQAENALIRQGDLRRTDTFHPLVGQTVLITGVHEHDGVCHYLIRQSDGGHFHLPDWMIDPAAGQIETVAVPRLPVSQLLQLRHLVDHLLVPCVVHIDG